MLSGEYENARVIYEDEKFKDNKAIQINLGYIYGNGLTYKANDIEKAIAYYEKADCIEAERNMLALYLKNNMRTEAFNLLTQLVQIPDEVTWDYVSNCLYDMSWSRHYEETGNAEIEFGEAINTLYEWEITSDYYSGTNPPDDTVSTKWVFQSVNFDVSKNSNFPYLIYRAVRIKWSKNIRDLEKIYYMDDNRLIPLQ